jgi:hypothetical protein
VTWFSWITGSTSERESARVHAARAAISASHATAIRAALAADAEQRRTVRPLLSYEDAVALVCQATGWPVGHVWVRGPEGWRSSGAWHDAGPEFADLKASTAATDLGSGRGIVAAVLHLESSRILSGLAGLGSTVRERDAAAIGLSTVVGVPLRRGTTIEAVFEFVTPDHVEAQDSLAEALLAVAAQARRRVPTAAEDDTAATAARKTVLLDIAMPVDLAG